MLAWRYYMVVYITSDSLKSGVPSWRQYSLAKCLQTFLNTVLSVRVVIFIPLSHHRPFAIWPFRFLHDSPKDKSAFIGIVNIIFTITYFRWASRKLFIEIWSRDPKFQTHTYVLKNILLFQTLSNHLTLPSTSVATSSGLISAWTLTRIILSSTSSTGSQKSYTACFGSKITKEIEWGQIHTRIMMMHLEHIHHPLIPTMPSSYPRLHCLSIVHLQHLFNAHHTTKAFHSVWINAVFRRWATEQ